MSLPGAMDFQDSTHSWQSSVAGVKTKEDLFCAVARRFKMETFLQGDAAEHATLARTR